MKGSKYDYSIDFQIASILVLFVYCMYRMKSNRLKSVYFDISLWPSPSLFPVYFPLSSLWPLLTFPLIIHSPPFLVNNILIRNFRTY